MQGRGSSKGRPIITAHALSESSRRRFANRRSRAWIDAATFLRSSEIRDRRATLEICAIDALR
jgi:hypothetical protein